MRRLGTVRAMVVILAGLLLLVSAANAHHGSASYRTDALVVLRHATVTRFLWANPHSMLLFDVTDDKGNVAHWTGEAGSPAAIRSLGWSKETLRSGDVITVQLYPSKFENDVGRIESIVLPGGAILANSPRTDHGDGCRY